MSLTVVTHNVLAAQPSNIIPLRHPLLNVRLCHVGPMVGRNRGHVTTQGEILTDGFRRAGYQSSPSAKSRLYSARAWSYARFISPCSSSRTRFSF